MSLLLLLVVACLTTVSLLVSLPVWAQREPVLKQIDEPHPYYFREMYLPQLTTGPSAVTWAPDSAAWSTPWLDRCGSRSSTPRWRSN